MEVAPIVGAGIDSIRLAADAKQIRVDFAPDPNAGAVLGDSASGLQQVIWNLLSNAIKFTPQGGRVQVRVERIVSVGKNHQFADGSINSHVEITVSDTGIGISPEFLPYVFERFRQANATTTRSYGGLGLGLAIARHLVELHGGTVGVRSPGKGQGATFTVKLPLFDKGEVRRVKGEIEDENSHFTLHTSHFTLLSGLRVLVVDDEADTREFLTVVLEEYAAEVRGVASAQEALEAIVQWKPDVLVSDIGMPQEDGYSFIRFGAIARSPERATPSGGGADCLY